MLDFDEKGHTDEIVSSLTPSPSPNGEGSEMTLGQLVVLLVEESVRRGTHVLVELPEGMTPEEAQALMQEATGFTPDAAVKDVARCIYMVPEDHTKYVSPKLFEVSEFKEGYTEGTVPQCSVNCAQQGQSPDGCAEKAASLKMRAVLIRAKKNSKAYLILLLWPSGGVGMAVSLQRVNETSSCINWQLISEPSATIRKRC